MFKRSICAVLFGCNLMVSVNAAGDQKEASQQSLTSVNVQISDVGKLEGSFKIALFTDALSYKVKETVFGENVAANSATVSMTFEQVPLGKVLALLYQDLNGNDKLDTNFISIPKEPYASSTGRRGQFGTPKWEDGAVLLSPGSKL
jgi:uncharacterized protein (DUF2141 family)